MFHFFNRTPEIVLDCFTSDNTVYLTTPIIKAGKAIPDWWKKLDPYEPTFYHTPEKPYHLNQDMTVRDCYAFIELYKRGAIVENWCDISFRTENGLYNFWYADGHKPVEHPKKQLGSAFPFHHHIKLSSPWAIREKSGAKFMWIGTEWSLDRFEIKVLPGVINFDIVSQINVNLMFPMRDGTFTLPVGNPLVQIIPLSDNNLKIVNHVVTEQEFKKITLTSNTPSFYGWKKTLQLRKRNRERGTCPFHGDKNGSITRSF